MTPSSPLDSTPNALTPEAARRALQSDRGLVVAGVLSGTSADGIDVALTRFREAPQNSQASQSSPSQLSSFQAVQAPELIAFETVPFPPGLGEELHRVLGGGEVSIPGLARLHLELGAAFGKAAFSVGERLGTGIDLVGSHGQTVWHFDGVGEPGSWQLGEGHQVAAHAQAPCVCDFRSAHVAAGGHGAPLSILADRRLFGLGPLPLAILNLGGMANLSILGEHPEQDLAFDTGPAGALLDGLARRLWEAPMDRGGRWAAAGQVRSAWVQRLLAHPFFASPLPRSTGRDTFGPRFLEAYLHGAGPNAAREDLMASAVQAVAQSVGESLRRFTPLPYAALKGVWVAGGGVHNRTLMSALQDQIGLPVASSAALGVDPDAREALLFACLAVDFVVARPVTVPGASAKVAQVVLGKWCYAPH